MVIWEGTPITKVIMVDDELLKSQAVGIDYVAINAPHIVIPFKNQGKELLIQIGMDWEVARNELIEKTTKYLEDAIDNVEEVVSKLEKFVANKIYLENTELITKIADKIKKNADDDNKKAKEALALIEEHSRELFVNEYGRAYAAIKVNDHTETLAMNDSRFKNWIIGLYHKETDKVLSDDDIKKVIRILEGRAAFDGDVKRYKLDIRVRGYNSETDEAVSAVDMVEDEDIENFTEIYYDLTNRNWEAIKITPEGWNIVRGDYPILFRRHGSELPQVYPVREYPPDILDQLISLQNISNNTHKYLKKVWLVACFWPNSTSKPIVMINAPQGAAKSTMSDMDRDQTDPNTSKTSSMPKDDINLKQYLSHNYLSSFDNVSHISDEQSDILCRAVTGGRDTKRKLFEDDEDVIYDYRRIVELNGIVNAATRPDLLERGLIIELEGISKKDRQLRRVIKDKANKMRPQVLGFCLDVISEVLAERQKWIGEDEYYFGLKDTIDANGGLPRMADFAVLGEQISAVIARKEGKPYEPGDFLRAWDNNHDTLNIEALKSSLLAEGLIAFMTNREAMKIGVDFKKYGDILSHWEGSPTMLLAELNSFIFDNSGSVKINTRAKAWPQDPTALGKEIATLKVNLEAIGIFMEISRTESNKHYHIIKKSKPLIMSKAPTSPTAPTGSQDSCSNDAQNPVGGAASAPTGAPTAKQVENEHENGPAVGHVGLVGQTPIIGAGMVYTMMKIAMQDTEFGTADNKDYFLGRVLKKYFMKPRELSGCGMTEDEADQTLQALIDDGTIVEEMGHGDMYKPTIQCMHEISKLNWWGVKYNYYSNDATAARAA